jgi:hypothetical protein
MDLEGQTQVLEVVDGHEANDLVVVLGASDPAAAEIFTLTLTQGDPTYAGPLSGVQLGLPVFHIFEREIKDQVAKDVYEREVLLSEIALDTDRIVSAVARARSGELPTI